MKQGNKMFVFILLTFVFLCRAGDENKSDKIRLQLRWYHQFQFAGYYMAKELGYFEQAGLDVEILEGGTDTDVMHKVIGGEAEYGVQTPSILVDRSKGHPVVVLAAIFQHSPVALVTSWDSGISSLPMLIGKTIMLGAKNVEIRAMLKNEDMLDKVTITEFNGSYEDVVSGKVSGASGYITDLSYIKGQNERTFSYIRPQTYGIDFYGDCLFTSESEIKNKPERALLFREASLKGWEYAMHNPEKAVEIIKQKFGTEKTASQLLYEYSQMNELMLPDLVDIGNMSPGRWKHILETFQKIGMIDDNYEIEGFLYSDYIKGDQSTVKIILASFAVVLFAGLVIMYVKYRNEKIKEAIEEAKHKEELLKSEARFRNLIEFGADGILLGSNDGYIIEVNETACSIIGMKKEDLIGKFITAVPFTKESLEKAPLRFDLLKEGKTVVNERDILRPDGIIVNLEMKTKIMADGSYQSIYRDITLKKTAEKEIISLKSWFEYVLGATKTGFDIIDEENNVIYVDPKWAEKLGDFKGRKCYEYFMGNNKSCPDCAIPEALQSGVPTISEEFLEKENRFIQVHTIPLNEKHNGKRLVSEFNIDITEKKNIENKLRDFNTELEKKVAERTVQLETANKELESFSYSVSHDLRAPVRHILGFADIFLKENKDAIDERSKDIFSKITSSAEKMEKLIDDLLTLSRTGRQDMTKKDIDMGSIVRSVTSDFKDCKEDRKVQINIAEMPVVKADHNLIKAVWENLMDNACKYTKKKAETEIFIGCRTEGGEHIFFIEDNGVGFDPEFSHKLFGVFQRLHLDKDFPGTGIGLANVRRIINRHGGRTWAESKGEEQGAVFYFSLPIK